MRRYERGKVESYRATLRWNSGGRVISIPVASNISTQCVFWIYFIFHEKTTIYYNVNTIKMLYFENRAFTVDVTEFAHKLRVRISCAVEALNQSHRLALLGKRWTKQEFDEGKKSQH